MDKLTLLGLVLGVTGITIGQLLEGSDLSILFQGAAFFIVFGGTLGAVMVQCQLRIFVTAMKMGRWAFVTPPSPGQDLARQLVDWSKVARKDGVLMLEMRTYDIEDPFLKKGLQLLVDGNTGEKIREVLDADTHAWEQLRWQSARVWEAAAGYILMEQAHLREMIIDGLVGIANGDNPRLLEIKLQSYLI
ncbi:MAG: flagellar motor protein [Nitrosomonadales bacterium]|nr:flagellar motor protein [Nitrosomonadales bacterium]